MYNILMLCSSVGLMEENKSIYLSISIKLILIQL